MKITVIGVGKVKEKFFAQGILEYEKRLSKYCKLDIIEVADEKTPDKASEREEFLIKQKEGEKILRAIKDNSYVVLLAIQGKQLASEELADTIHKLGIKGESHITFIIGGSLGTSDEVASRADYLLSFSRMTFPHQMMRMILLEQVYRGFRIINGEPYHK